MFLYSWHWHGAQQHKRTHCCVSTATMVTLTCHNGTLHAQCLHCCIMSQQYPTFMSINCTHPIWLLSCCTPTVITKGYFLRKLQWQYVGLKMTQIWIFTLFIPCVGTQLLQYKADQMHTCYNLISQSVFYMFPAMKAHHQEVSWNNTRIMVWCMSMYMVCGESSVCGYTGIAIKVITGHIKVHLKK